MKRSERPGFDFPSYFEVLPVGLSTLCSDHTALCSCPADFPSTPVSARLWVSVATHLACCSVCQSHAALNAFK